MINLSGWENANLKQNGISLFLSVRLENLKYLKI